MARLTWLHLSDWHQRGEDFDRKVVRDKLLDDLRQRTRIDPALSQIDFVVFSGDLAYSGQEKEYLSAQKHLLDPVLKAVDLGPERLFLVPGNHDLARGELPELPPALQQPLTSESQVQERLTDARKRERALEPFAAYRQFVAGYTGQPSPAYASLCRWEIQGRRVALLGLNSAWMCGRNKNAAGEVDDYGQLVVGEPQLHDALAEMADAAVRIVVLHHPFEWLCEFDRQRIQRRVREVAHFVLCGYTHVPSVQPSSGTDGACVLLPAGATYDRRVAQQRYANAYNFVHLDFEAGQGKAFLRRFSDTRTAWIEDVETCDGGASSFPLPKEPRRASLSGAHGSAPSSELDDAAGHAPASTSTEATEARRQREAEARYRQLLLESCDIVDLAGLPEQDRLLVQRRLELRRLYVPLRARVEVAIGEEDSDEQWQGVEHRRHAAWLGRTGKEAGPLSEARRVSIGERLSQARRLVVLGDPGAGKTTLTRWITTAYLLRLRQDPDWKELNDVHTLPDEDWLPIIVRCRDLEDAACLGGSLDDVLRHTLRKAELSEEEGEALRTLLRTRLTRGKALLILDGLDEIADPTARARFCQQIERIVVAYPEAPVLATSRVVGYREMGYRLGRGFEHLTLADLTREEKDDFAARWSLLTELPERRDKVAADLIRDIHSSDRIERLTGNPMLLTTLALVRRKVGRLPRRRADLYWEAVHVLLHWRSEVDEPLEWRETVPQLEYLAYAMCDRGMQRLTEEEVLDLLRCMRREYPSLHAVHRRTPEAFLQAVESRTGLLVAAGHVRHLGRPVPIYEFRHLTFQEYLAARALVDRCFPGWSPASTLAQDVAPLAGLVELAEFEDHDAWDTVVAERWREPLRLCVSICKDEDVDPVLRAILTPLSDQLPGTPRARTILATFCLADEPNVTEATAQLILSTLVAQVTERDGHGLITTGIDAAVMEVSATRWAGLLRQNLVQGFMHEDPFRRDPLGGLVVMTQRATFARMPDVQAWFKDETARLSSKNEARAIEAALGLMQLFYEDRIIEVGDAPSYLGEGLARSAPMSHAAAWALGWLRGAGLWHPNAQDTQRLVDFIGQADADPAALCWVADIAWHGAGKEVRTALIPLLHHPDSRVRMAVIPALAKDKGHTRDFLRPLLRDSNDQVRRDALQALAQSLDATDRRLLTQDLDGEFPWLDPQEPIDGPRIDHTAQKLNLSARQVRTRYRALADRFGLRLAFGRESKAKRRSTAKRKTP
jgi:hypothetical protein